MNDTDQLLREAADALKHFLNSDLDNGLVFPLLARIVAHLEREKGELSVHWVLEGQRKQEPARWDAIDRNADTEEETFADEREYRKFMAEEKTGWLDFRVVRVTTHREILPAAARKEDGT